MQAAAGMGPRRRLAWAGAAGGATLLAATFLAGALLRAGGPRPTAPTPAVAPDPAAPAAASGEPALPPAGFRSSEEDRAVAFGLLLDTPVSPRVLDEAIALAEALRLRYGIDTGNVQADRQEAAERALREGVEPLTFTDGEIAAAARDLGYSLDPAECANYCDNVRRLALVELRKRALRALAYGAEVEPRAAGVPALNPDTPGS
jgi:hypothetical protein